MTDEERAKCFLCQARGGPLRAVGQLWACTDSAKCDERRAERIRLRDTGRLPGSAK